MCTAATSLRRHGCARLQVNIPEAYLTNPQASTGMLFMQSSRQAHVPEGLVIFVARDPGPLSIDYNHVLPDPLQS